MAKKQENIKEENVELENLDDDMFVKQESGIFKFEREGDTLIGELVNKEKSKSYDNMVYKIRTGDEVVTVFGTTVLDSNMYDINHGDIVKIVFEGVKESEKGKAPTKMFSVYKKR